MPRNPHGQDARAPFHTEYVEDPFIYFVSPMEPLVVPASGKETASDWRGRRKRRPYKRHLGFARNFSELVTLVARRAPDQSQPCGPSPPAMPSSRSSPRRGSARFSTELRPVTSPGRDLLENKLVCGESRMKGLTAQARLCASGGGEAAAPVNRSRRRDSHPCVKRVFPDSGRIPVLRGCWKGRYHGAVPSATPGRQLSLLVVGRIMFRPIVSVTGIVGGAPAPRRHHVEHDAGHLQAR